MSVVTVTLPQDLLAEMMSLVGTKDKTEAVIIAVKGEIFFRAFQNCGSRCESAS